MHEWTPQYFRLFITHASSDKARILAIRNALFAHGIDAFAAHVDIGASTEWLPELASALESMDGILAYLTPAFQRSDWTDQETGFAWARRREVVPVLLSDGVLPYGFLSSIQALFVESYDYAVIAARVAGILHQDARSAEKMKRAQFAMEQRRKEVEEQANRWAGLQFDRTGLWPVVNGDNVAFGE